MLFDHMFSLLGEISVHFEENNIETLPALTIILKRAVPASQWINIAAIMSRFCCLWFPIVLISHADIWPGRQEVSWEKLDITFFSWMPL